MRSALQHPLPAVARPWRGVCVVANMVTCVVKNRVLCTAYKVAVMIT